MAMTRVPLFLLLLAGAPGCGGAMDAEEDETGDDGVGQSVAAASQPGIGPLGTSPNYYKCADEHGLCPVDIGYVAFGARGKYLFKPSFFGISCDSGTFGGDPIEGVVKACYATNYLPAADEHQQYNLSGPPRDIAYGSNGRFRYKSLSGLFTCDNDTFGGDPTPDVPKQCLVPLAGYAVDVAEHGTMTGLNNTPIAYGANGKYVFEVASGPHPCNNDAFGRDPAVGIPKHCYKMPAVRLAIEGQSYVSPGAFYLSGLNGLFTSSNTTGFSVCNTAAFPGDPDLDHPNACYEFTP